MRGHLNKPIAGTRDESATIISANTIQHHELFFDEIELNNHDTSKRRAAVASDENIIAKIGVNMNVLNELIPPLVENFFPNLIEALEDSVELNATETVGDSVFGGRISANLKDFFMKPVKGEDLSISAVRGPLFPENSLRLKVETGVINAGFNDVGLVAEFNAFDSFGGCNIETELGLKVNSIDLIFDLFATDPTVSTTNFSFKASDVNVNGFDLDFNPSFDCSSVLLEIPLLLLGGLTQTLSSLFIVAINENLIDFVLSQIPQRTFEIPATPPMNIVRNNTLSIDYRVPKFYVTSDSIVVESSLEMGAELTTPEWRAGCKHTAKPNLAGNHFPKPSTLNLANANIGADVLNNFLDALWYVLWSDIGTDERAANSTLCRPTLHDPCPLPPFIEVFRPSNLLFWILVPFNMRFRRDFILSGQIEAPYVEFKNGDRGDLYITTPATLLLEGTRLIGGNEQLLATITTNINLAASSLEYDSETGNLSGLQITDFTFDNMRAESPGNRPLLGTNVILNQIERILRRIIRNRIVDIANAAITSALSSIPQIPMIPDFPTVGQSLQISVTNVTMTGTSATETSQSYLYVGAGIGFDVLSNISIPVPDEKVNKNDENTILHSQNLLEETMFDWAKKSENPNAYFFWSHQSSLSGSVNMHAYKYDENMDLVEVDSTATNI